MDDDDLADHALASGHDDDRARGPSIATWSTEAAYLAAAVDRIGEMIAALIHVNGGKPPKVKPLPRPFTAFERAHRRRSLARHRSLVAEVNEARKNAGGGG